MYVLTRTTIKITDLLTISHMSMTLKIVLYTKHIIIVFCSLKFVDLTQGWPYFLCSGQKKCPQKLDG